MKPVAGIDFGTTNSALAILQSGKVRPISADNANTGEKTLRSTLFIDEENEIFVGQKALQEYVEAGGHYGRFMQSLKAFLPSNSFRETFVYGRRYTIEHLVSLILSEIKRIGEEAIGQPLEEVVLGRPVYFSDNEVNDKLAEQRLEEAAAISGFKSIQFELEPVAATLAYLNQMPAGTEQTILMGDFGGGTSDFTVMNLRAGADLTFEQKRERVLAIDGVYIGGDTFDGRIMWEMVSPYFGRYVKNKSPTGQILDMPLSLIHPICEWHKLPFMRNKQTQQSLRYIRATADQPQLIDNLEHLIWESRGFAVFQSIEKAKIALSSTDTTTIHYEDRVVSIEERISRPEFEGIISKDVDAITSCISRCITTAGLAANKIDKVLLTGGSSYIPAIRNVFESQFGSSKVVVLDAFTSVAQGLALSAR